MASPSTHQPERVAIICWVARIGAVTAEALAHRQGCSVAAARARLLAAERAQLLIRTRPLVGRPALYTVTRAGLRVSGLHGLEPCRVTAATAAHAIACADAAAKLERCYPEHRLTGERELRSQERAFGGALASASLGEGADGAVLLHRPDIVLWPERPHHGLPVAVEVELTVKAPQRLLEICRAWARCRCVAGVLYLAAPDAHRALARAISRVHAQERIALLELAVLDQTARAPAAPREASQAQRRFQQGGQQPSNGEQDVLLLDKPGRPAGAIDP
ncbi:MAG: hypothetical protein QOI03_1293 [Solirubrobacteraceae bacterium]|jgi:hypothetical protein|nr:hypothetical protein [Solirubrobacteraceae bacterium]